MSPKARDDLRRVLIRDVDPADEEEGEDDLIDELLAIPPNANRVEAHCHYAAFKAAEHPDEVQAREVARRFCRSEQETSALLELGRIEGDHMSAMLMRWDTVYETKGSNDED